MNYQIVTSEYDSATQESSDRELMRFTATSASQAWWTYVGVLAEYKSIAMGEGVMDGFRNYFDTNGWIRCNGIRIDTLG